MQPIDSTLQKLLGASDPYHGDAYMYAMELRKNHPSLVSHAIHKLILKLKSPNVLEAISGLSVLGHGNREVIDTLAKKLEDQDPNVIVSAANALEAVSTESINANRNLTALFTHDNPDVATAASFAVLKTDPKNDIALGSIKHRVEYLNLFDQSPIAYRLFPYDHDTALQILRKISLKDEPASLNAISILGIIGQEYKDPSLLEQIKKILTEVSEASTNNRKHLTIKNVLAQLTN